MKKVMSILLLLTTLLTAAACGGTTSTPSDEETTASATEGPGEPDTGLPADSETENQTETETTEPEEELPPMDESYLNIIYGKASTFTVVRPASLLPAYEVIDARAVRDAMLAATGYAIENATDAGQSVPEGTSEVLVGSTNRPETAAAKALAGDGQYIIKAYDTRLVIYSATEPGLREAVDVFVSRFVEDGSRIVRVPKDFELIADTKYKPEKAPKFDETVSAELAQRWLEGVFFLKGFNHVLDEGRVDKISTLDLECKPYASDAGLMIPAEYIVRRYGGSGARDGQTFVLDLVGSRITLTPGSADALVDGEKITLKAAAEEKNGIVFITVSDAAALLGKKVYESDIGLAVISDAENIFEGAGEYDLVDTAAMIKREPLGIVDFDVSVGRPAAELGQPAIMDPGKSIPGVSLTFHYDVTDASLSLLAEDDTVLQTITLGDMAADSTAKPAFEGKVADAGTFRMVLNLKVNGRAYDFVRYYTALAAAPFKTAGNVALCYKDENGKLTYTCDVMGNRFLDYSEVGYEHGADLPDDAYIASLPHVTVSPVQGDNAPAIQAAIDSFKDKPADAKGYRGVVELAPGTYPCDTTFNVGVSGVILRGATGKSDDVVILYDKLDMTVSNNGEGKPDQNDMIRIDKSTSVGVTGSYLASGTTTFEVEDASGFKPGDTVAITKKVTFCWLHLVGMDNLVRSGERQTWIAEGSEIFAERTIIAVDGNRITLDTGVSDAYDAAYLGYPVATVAKYTRTGSIDHTGVEYITIRGAGFDIENNYNSWARGVHVDECIVSNAGTGKLYVGNSIRVMNDAKYVTLKDCVVTHSRNENSAPPADYTIRGTYVLLDGCTAPMKDDRNTWNIVFQGRNCGPIVAYRCVSAACPHQRWQTGVLWDSCSTPKSSNTQPGVQFLNRSTQGSGQGWTIAWSLVWNSTAQHFKVCDAPGSVNWCIGGVGSKLNSEAYGVAEFYSHGTPIAWGSLYEAQLAERLGGK